MENNMSVPLDEVLEIEQYIAKYNNIEKLLTVIEDNYFVGTIEKYNKNELAFETSIVFPLIQGVMSIIGDIMRDTNDRFSNTFKDLVKVYSV